MPQQRRERAAPSPRGHRRATASSATSFAGRPPLTSETVQLLRRQARMRHRGRVRSRVRKELERQHERIRHTQNARRKSETTYNPVARRTTCTKKAKSESFGWKNAASIGQVGPRSCEFISARISATINQRTVSHPHGEQDNRGSSARRRLGGLADAAASPPCRC